MGRKLSGERKLLLERQKSDWFIDEKQPPPDSFDSMFTNWYGEVWWCKYHEGQLIVWGEDVDNAVAVSAPGVDVVTTPWVMHDAEKAWLQANVLVAQQRWTAMARRR